jgi:MYXO-CTERM domain-containing protein
MSAECDASCTGKGPSVDCKARCEASCQGSCTGEARAECQVDCQAEGYVKCEGDLKVDCEAQCSKPEGALFCDSQYVDNGGNLAKCQAAIEAWLEANAKFEASGSASCENGSCEAEGEASASCATVPGGPAGGAVALFGMIVAGAALGRRRRA